MTQFPSDLRFASLLQYSPRGTSQTSADSRKVINKIKNDGYFGQVPAIPYSIEKLSAALNTVTFLAKYLGNDVTLIPVPRSSLTQPGSLWPADRICDCLVTKGLGADISRCLKRITPVAKAAFAPPGQRPEPKDRGSSFIGMYPHVRAAFPNATIQCFALIRTMSSGDVANILNPIEGFISFKNGTLNRHP